MLQIETGAVEGIGAAAAAAAAARRKNSLSALDYSLLKISAAATSGRGMSLHL